MTERVDLAEDFLRHVIQQTRKYAHDLEGGDDEDIMLTANAACVVGWCLRIEAGDGCFDLDVDDFGNIVAREVLFIDGGGEDYGPAIGLAVLDQATRIAAKIAAYIYAFVVNRMLGRPQGRIKELWA